MRILATALLIISACVAGAASAETRLALIIANQNYAEDVGPLNNPHNDAALMRRTLERHAFDVRVVTEASRSQILSAVSRFARQLGAEEDAVGFLYYTGHGAARPGANSNYLIPITVSDAATEALWFDSVRLEEVREILRSRAPRAAHIVVFDACRSELQLAEEGKTLGDDGKGFVAMGNFGGMLTAFSASPGEIASDGEKGDRAGPYALALAAALDRAHDQAQSVSAASLFSGVRFAMRDAGARQRPLYLDGLDRPVSFGGSTRDGSREELAQSMLDRVWDSRDPVRLQVVADQFPDTAAGKVAAIEAEALRREAEAARWAAELLAAEEQRQREEQLAQQLAEEEGKRQQEEKDRLAALEAARRRQEEAERVAALEVQRREAEDQRRREEEAQKQAKALRRERAAQWETLKDGRDIAALEAFAADPTAPFSDDATALLEAHYRDAQTALATLGLYTIRIDGDWGPSSRRALTAFQQSQGVSPADGAMTEALLGALSLAASEAEQKAEAEARRSEEARRREAASSARQPGETFRDCPECPEMVVIPGGSFFMGSPASELHRNRDEGPQRTVWITPFAMGKYEVTFEEWDACVSAGGCSRRPDDEDWGRGRRPVIDVSWNDAQEYVAWLNSRVSGAPYRLPSEAEWEYAARAGWTAPFWTGLRITSDQANFKGNSYSTYNGSAEGAYRRQTVPVGSFAANPWGLHDVHGNVWEWVQDCWNGSYSGAPIDGSAWTSGDCSRAILRGGAWNLGPGSIRSADRLGGLRRSDRHKFGGGFRVARTLN